MELADRLGWIALIMAFLGLGITILWPTRRPIGWISLAIGAILGCVWAWLEYHPPHKNEPELAVVKKEPETKPEPSVQPMKRRAKTSSEPALEVVEFNTHSIQIANNTPSTIYLLDLSIDIKEPPSTKGFFLNAEIPARTIYKHPMKEGFDSIRTLNKLADSWGEHYKKAKSLYGACGMELSFFSKSDPAFQQLENFHAQHGGALAYDDAVGKLFYRIVGSAGTKTEAFPAVVTTTTNAATCPQ